MACLEKLKVLGIRSFGPDASDEATLKFARPVTIILGQNGCGKTTIIEALKYATCGDLPANCSQGSGFVHDPKLCKRAEVRAQVKLSILDVKGKKVDVSKSMLLTQKASKQQFKTIDQTITRQDRSGQTASISGRCADIDAEMCEALGVSKAILNSVIFCHQEDSNWPLDEGKKLKEKFDLIFDVAKYNKALDNIKINKKMLETDIKDLKTELEHREKYKDEATEKKAKLRDEETRKAAIEDQIRTYESEMGPITRDLQELVRKEMTISKLNVEKAKKSATLDAIKTSIMEYTKGITNPFEGSMEDLLEAIHSFEDQLSKQESKLQALEDESNRVLKQEEQIAKKASEEQIKQGHLTRDKEHNEDLKFRRNTALTELSDRLQLSANTSILTEGDVVHSKEAVESAISKMESDLESLREEGEIKDKEMQAKMDSKREEKSRMQQSMILKKQQRATNKLDKKKFKQEIEEVNQSTDTLNRLKKQLEDVHKSIVDLNKATDVEQLDEEIKQSENRRDRIEEDYAALEREVRELQANNQLQTELNIQLEAKNSKDAEIRKLRNKTNDILVQLLGNVPDSGIKHALQACISTLAQDVQTKQEDIQNKQHQLTTLEADRKHLREKCRDEKQTLDRDKEDMYEVCQSREYGVVLDEVKIQLTRAQDDKGTLKASEIMYKRYVEKLKQKKPGCPLCHRPFDEEHESSELITELQSKMQGLPKMVADKEKELENLLDRQNRLQQLRPTYERISKLQKSVPALLEQLSSAEIRLEAKRKELADLKDQLMSPQSDKALAESIQSDVALMDQHLIDVKKIDKEISKLRQRLPQAGSIKSLDDALSEQDTLRNERDVLRRSLHSLQTKKNKHIKELHELQAQKNSVVEKQLKIQGGVQKKKQLEDRLDELNVEELKLEDELALLITKMRSAEEELEAAIVEKENERESHNGKVNEARSKVGEFVKQFDNIKRYHESVEAYERSGGLKKLEAVQQRISRLNSEKDLLARKKESLQTQIDEVKANLSNQQVYQRELDDNLKLRQKQGEKDQLVAEVDALNENIGGMDLEQVVREKDRLRKKEEDISKQKQYTEGRRQELIGIIKSLGTELQKEDYKNAERRYSDTLIKLKVNSAAVFDLNEYNRALTWTITHFHNERMKNINTIIADLWTQIYGGNDIDFIQIRNDEDKSTSSNKRQVYNYRVVMVKNGQEMDMRGRCSAGQKMLACLIIRMALAEVFSSHCGILTLDEPTTNLDKENIERLCIALANLITLREEKNSSFQLVVITHDDEFIEQLTNMHKVDCIFRVSRNPRGKSQVTQVMCN